MIFLTHFQASKILQCETEISLDLGITKSKIEIRGREVIFPDSQHLGIEEIRKIAKDKRTIYLLKEDHLHKIQFFDEKTKKFYKLVVVEENSPPTLEISGIHMHRVKNTNPLKDTLKKVSSIPIHGVGLDTCTGLGYTSIMASEKANRVVTVEIDKNVFEIARLNPWSRKLFSNRTKIDLILGDVFYLVRSFRKKFDFIIHDPPRYSLAPKLYSQEFYHYLYKILKKPGYLFHYTGKPEMKKRKKIIANIKARLKRAGFTVRWKEEALGYICNR